MALKPVTWLAAMPLGLQHRSSTSAFSATGQAHTYRHATLGCTVLAHDGSPAAAQSNIHDSGGHQVKKLHAAVVHEEERLFNTWCRSRCMCQNYCFQILIAH